jgi:2-dehydro-3-deoxyphosphogluconate aldolase/(4S)-4-hydroxy-2-oxoglutarate aldolase
VNKDAFFARIRAERIIASVSADIGDDLVHCAQALSRGGINTLELTLTTPSAIATLKAASEALPEFSFGLGTVIDVDTAQRGILAGASFIVTPAPRPSVITLCRRYHVPVISSAHSRSDIAAAHAAGADAVKIFSGDNSGPDYIKALMAEFPNVVMIPIGGVTPGSITPFLESGATAVFAGITLVDESTWRAKKWAVITERSDHLAGRVVR